MGRFLKLKDPKSLPLIKSYLERIFADFGGSVHIKDLHSQFLALAKCPFKRYFLDGKRLSIKEALIFILGDSVQFVDCLGGFKIKYATPNTPQASSSSIPSANTIPSNQLTKIELTSIVPTKSRVECVRDLQKAVEKSKGVSEKSPISVDDSSDDEDESVKNFSELMTDDYNELPLINYNEIVTNFKHYYTFQEIHVAYVRLRLVAFFLENDIKRFTDKTLHEIFKTVYRENFFNKDVLRYYVNSKIEAFDDDSTIPVDSNKTVINKFLKRFCGDFFEQESQIITLKEEPKNLYSKCYETMFSILKKVEATDSFDCADLGRKIKENLSVLGRFQHNNERIDVVASTNNPSGTRQPWFNFSSITLGTQTLFPTLDEINERVKFTRKRICREGRSIKIVEIVNDICEYYKVPNLQSMKIQGVTWQLRREADIPAIHDIIKTQGNVNAFIHAFVTFHNICTLHELREAICQFNSKATFEELRLGPFQQQLIVYDQFQFPPDRANIPTITTKDVFQLLWKLQRKLYNERQTSGKIVVPLEEFMQFIMAEYGFESPFESGVKIGSMGLAISVVRKAWFSNFHYLKDISTTFHQSICLDMKSLVTKGAKDINAALKVNPQKTYNEYTKEITGLPIMEAFLQIFRMVKNLKQQVTDKLPGKYTFVEFSGIISDVMTLIKSDAILSNIFHIILSAAPLKALGKSDISVLKCLGFGQAIKEIILEEERIASKRIIHQRLQKSNFVAKGLLVQTVKKWLEKNPNLDLNELHKLEQQILREINPNVYSFEELGHGSFLKFISLEADLKSIINLQSVNNIALSNSIGISQDFIHDFLVQCDGHVSEDNLANGVIDQFQVNENSKVTVLQCIRKTAKETHQKSPVIYEKALTIGLSNEKTSNWELRGIAGNVLKIVPVMTNLEKWSNWELIYQPKIGSLSDFLRTENLPMKSEFHFLEVSPNHHVKISKDCSINDLVEALESWNPIKTCDCLISIIISHGRIESAPITLISSHFQNAFLKEEHMYEIDDSSAVFFALKCFTLIPFRILSCIANKIFLSNLSMTHGSTNVSEILLKNCRNSEERYILHALGMHLLNPLWIGDMKNMHDIINNPNEIETCEMVVDSTGDDETQPEKIESATANERSETEDLSNKNDEVTEALPVDSKEVVDEEDSREKEEKDPCISLIETIRREQFGIGVNLDKEQKNLLEVHRQREGRSLQRLSKELYSTDSHFALELIQNADDNEYDFSSLHEGEEPSVAFILHTDKIVVLNNEKGFMTDHIRALCDVGKSTKGIHRKGYIGQKGIGFKSVFRITDSPEIHSNGYHIKFDASEGPNGYILPTWIEEGEAIDLQAYSSKFDNEYKWMTSIILPLKKDMPINRLVARFYDVHPSLLMFLNKLQKIIIADEFSGKMNIMKKRKVDKNILEVSQNEKSQLWFIVSKEVSLKIKDEVKETDVALAFPIGQKELHPQPVFAYLPLRSYGFKFIIQADFEIPSSREDVYRDNSWNQCILQNIPDLIMDAFHEFKNHSYFHGINGILEFFKFMDIEEHVLGVFQPVAKQVIKSLQKEKCLPIADPSSAFGILKKSTTENSMEKKDYKWSNPSSILFSQAKLEQAISPHILEAYLQMYYLHNHAQAKLSRPILTSLGVRSISLDQLLQIAVKYLQKNSPTLDNYKWLSRWFLTIYDVLQDSCDFTEASLTKIRKAAVFPLSNGKLIPVEGNIVFLPNLASKKQSAQQDCMDVIQNDLNVLHFELINNVLDTIEKKQFIHFLGMLGLKLQNPKQLLNEHIFPILKSDVWKEKSEIFLVACIKYLFHLHIDKNPNISLGDLKKILVLKTNKGMKKICESLIYIPRFYGNPLDLQSLFPSGNWLLVSEVYGEGRKLLDIDQWYQFFYDLGLKKSFSIQLNKVTMDLKEVETSLWETDLKTWPKTDDNTYVINDLIIPEFFLILEYGREKEIVALSSAINEYWSSDFEKFNLSTKNCVVSDTNGKEICRTYSTLLLKMQTSPWIISLPPPLSPPKLYRPSELYVSSADFLLVFGDKVNYMCKRFTNSDFIKALGIRTTLTKEIFLEEFSKWIEEKTFASLYDHIMNVYKYIAAWLVDDVDFKDKPVIFLPSDNAYKMSKRGKQFVEGKFWPCSAVCFSDPSGVLYQIKKARYKVKILDYFYPTTEEFVTLFTKTLKIQKQPSFDDYLSIVEGFAPTIFLPDKDECNKIYNIFAVLRESLLKDNSRNSFNDLIYPDYIDDQLKFYDSLSHLLGSDAQAIIKKSNVFQQNILPTNQNHFVSIENQPLLCFNKELATPFSSCKKVDLIFIEDIYKSLKLKRIGTARYIESSERKFVALLIFLKACNITTLTSVYLEPEVITENLEKGCLNWEKTLHNLFPIIQRYIKSKLPILSAQLCNQIHDNVKFSEYLFNSIVFLAEKLEVVYRLKDRSDVNVSKPKICAIEKYGSKALIYIQKSKSENNFETILKEILTIFIKDDELKKEQLLDFLLDYMAVHDKQYFLRRKHVFIVDRKDETIWEYPKPFEEEKIPEKPANKQEKTTSNEVKTPVSTPKNKSNEKKMLLSWPPKKPTNYKEKADNKEEPLSKKWERPPSPDSLNKEKAVKKSNREAKTSLPIKRKATEEDANESESKAKKVCEDKEKVEDKPENINEDKEEGEISDDEDVVGNADNRGTGNEGEQAKVTEGEEENKMDIDAKDKKEEGSTNEKDDSETTTQSGGLPKPRLFNPLSLPIYDLDAEYEDLPLTNIVQTVPSMNFREKVHKEKDKENMSMIGLYGEEIVFNHLLKVYESEIDNNEIQIEWLNSQNETGEPYDMKVTYDSGKVVYIEVKATLYGGRKEFEISFQQIKFALEHGDCFHLYRVTGLNKPESLKIKRLVNLSNYLDKKAVKLFMVL